MSLLQDLLLHGCLLTAPEQAMLWHAIRQMGLLSGSVAKEERRIMDLVDLASIDGGEVPPALQAAKDRVGARTGRPGVGAAPSC